MKKPLFRYSNTVYNISWILTVPILIEISTACTLFSLWIAWFLYILVLILSIIRLVHGFAQRCYKFCWSLIAQLLLGAIILGFFHLSFNNVIHSPFSHSVAPDVVEVANPVLVADSTKNKTLHEIGKKREDYDKMDSTSHSFHLDKIKKEAKEINAEKKISK